MIIDKRENTVIIAQEKASVKTLVNNIEQSYDKYKAYHIIVRISSLEQIQLSDVIEFLRLSNNHRAQKKSFVVVSSQVNIDEMPDEIVVVPTIEEAFNIIEMEDIERDLGF